MLLFYVYLYKIEFAYVICNKIPSMNKEGVSCFCFKKRSHKSNVYTVLLDATKAFDRVNYCKLFRKLLDRNMSRLVLRLLLYMYTNQSLHVRWGSRTSTRFNVHNGVKQGGVLSTILFSVYIDGLFTRLSNSGIVCHIGNHYACGVEVCR